MDYTKIIPGKSAFQLLRTNPALTGNIKLTVDGGTGIWMNSIDANAEMTQDKYKNYAVDTSRSHPYNLYKVLGNGTVNLSQFFAGEDETNLGSVPSDYKDQYDYDNYWAGVNYLNSKYYTQKLTYFAPIYLGSDMPDSFVIMRVPTPMNTTSDVSKQIYESGSQTANDYFKAMMQGATIVKTFDLTEASVAGKYIRSIATDSTFPSKALTVSYRKDVMTYYAGTFIQYGVYTKIGEDLSAFFAEDHPLKHVEEYITDGFQRNGIIYPWIVNMEFIFDDLTVSNYDLSRYVGFYVNQLELAQLRLNETAMFGAGRISKKDYVSIGEVYDLQTDANGILLMVNDYPNATGYDQLIYGNGGEMLFPYVKDKLGNLRTLSYTSPIQLTDGVINSVRLAETSVDMSAFFGAGSVFAQDQGTLRQTLGRSNVQLVATQFGYGDKVRLFYPLGSRTSSDGRSYDDFECVIPYGSPSLWTDSPISQPGDSYYYYDGTSTDDSGNSVTCDVFYFNGANVNNSYNSVVALANAINSTKLGFFTAYPMGDVLLICVTEAAYYDQFVSIEYIAKLTSSYANVTIEGATGSVLEGKAIGFSGGSATPTRLAIDAKYESGIRSNFGDLLLSINNGGWAIVDSVSLDEDALNNDTVDQLASDYRAALGQYQAHAIVTIDSDYKPSLNEGIFHMAEYFNLSLGILSFLPYMDFDFDFYSDRYETFPEWELYKYFYVPPGKTVLQDGATYQVVNGRISYNGSVYDSAHSSPTIDTFTVNTPIGYSTSYTVPAYWNQNAIVLPIGYSQILSGTEGLSAGVKYRVIDGVISRQLVGGGTAEYGMGIHSASPSSLVTNEFTIDSQLLAIPVGNVYSYLINTGRGLYVIDMATSDVVYAGSQTLAVGHSYAVKATVLGSPAPSISYNGQVYYPGDSFTAALGPYSYVLDFTVVSGNPQVVYQQVYPQTYPQTYSSDNTLTIGDEYIVVGTTMDSGEIIYNGSVYSDGGTFYAGYDSTELYSYQTLSNDAFVIYTAPDDMSPTVPLLDGDNDIASFAGYFRVRGDSTATDTSSVQYMDRDRFYDGQLSTEYDFYEENYTKDFAYTSKLVPHICKWGFANGMDARGNPYRLNNSAQFGLDNLSPSHYALARDPGRLTHEWEYIQAKYPEMSDATVKAENYCYFDTPFDLDQFISDPTYFMSYFAYTPTHDGLAVADTQHRYSLVSYNPDTQLCETMFRGAFISFKDVISGSTLPNGLPAYKAASTRFDGYMFSAIIVPVQEQINKLATDPISHKFVENADAKAIVLVTTINLPCTNQLGPDVYGLGWVGPAWPGTQFASNAYNYDEVNGDYRFTFDAQGMCDLTYLAMYSVSNKKYNNLSGSYSNVKISSWLDFYSADYTDLKFVKANKYDSNGFSDMKLTDEVSSNGSNNFIVINTYGSGVENLQESQQMLYDAAFGYGVTTYDFQVYNNLSQINDSGLYFSNLSIDGFYNMEAGSLNITSEPYTYFMDASFKQLQGGKGYMASIFSKLTFSYLKELINGVSPSISVLTYAGGVQTSAESFYLTISDPGIITKTNILKVAIDANRPPEYAHEPIIGYVFQNAPLINGYQLARYEGSYAPIFRPVLFFERSLQVGSDVISLANVNLAKNVPDFGLVDHAGILKVAGKQIMKLQSDPAYALDYEYISEIVTDKVSLEAFRSAWEFGYHLNYTGKNTSVPVAGSLSVVDDHFTGGKVMDVPDSIDLRNPVIGTDLTYTVNTSTVSGSIFSESQLITYLATNGAQASIAKWLVDDPTYIGPGGIANYVSSWLEANIVGLYQVAAIEFWVQYNGDATNVTFVTGLSDQDLINQGYVQKRDAQINKIDAFDANFIITREVNRGMTIAPIVKINLI